MVDMKKVLSCSDACAFAPRAAGAADERGGGANSPVVLHEAKQRKGVPSCRCATTKSNP